MSFIASKETETNKVEFSFSVEKEAFEAAVNKAYLKNKSKISIPGFRKGKATKAIVEKFYGKGVFYEDAMNDILPELLEKYSKETGFKAVGYPSVDNVDFENEDGIIVTASFARYPDVSLKSDYKGLSAVKTIIETTDADVEEALAQTQERYARTIEVTDRAAQKDDTANIDYEGFCDGVAFEGGKAEGHDLVLGSNTFIPGFEDQIIGKNIGEEFDVNVTFPEEYHAENLKGKAAVFKCKLNKITCKELPALDDEFAKDASEFDTLDEYKKDIKAKIQKSHEDDADMRAGNDLANQLCDLVEAEIPSVMFERETENLVREYDFQLRQQGFNLQLLMQYTGMKIEDIRARYANASVANVKKQLALDYIVEKENIVPTEEEIEKRYNEIAESYNMKVEEVKEKLEAEAITEELKTLKAFELIKNSASITERTISKEEFEAEQKAANEEAAANQEEAAKDAE